jgi:hypothetical protein
MLNVRSSSSGSVATICPTKVPFAAFSSMEKETSETIGAMFMGTGSLSSFLQDEKINNGRARIRAEIGIVFIILGIMVKMKIFKWV